MTHINCKLTAKNGISSGTPRSVIEYGLSFSTITLNSNSYKTQRTVFIVLYCKHYQSSKKNNKKKNNNVAGHLQSHFCYATKQKNPNSTDKQV